MLRPHLDYRIVDAQSGELERGRVSVDALAAGQPWPEPSAPGLEPAARAHTQAED